MKPTPTKPLKGKMKKIGKLVGVCNCQCHCDLKDCFVDHDKPKPSTLKPQVPSGVKVSNSRGLKRR